MPKNKLLRLQRILKDLKRVVVAYSGGLDSGFLLKIAVDVLGRDNVLAVIMKSAAFPRREHENAINLARWIGAKYVTISAGKAVNKIFLKNSADRCYHCKKDLFRRLMGIAKNKEFYCVIDGSNPDDRKDLRFGAIAARELGIRSPLAESGIGKREIRLYSRRLGLSTWDKPPFACLASRIPYGESVTRDKLKMIDAAESALSGYGLKQVRVRMHGGIARLEISHNDIDRFLDAGMRKAVIKALKKLGFLYITLDLEGYRPGSMNEALI